MSKNSSDAEWSRRSFLAKFGAAAAAAGAAWSMRSGSAFADDAAGRPNIIVFVADDLGYADTGFQGCKDIPTPNIDSIAGGGVRFTDGYVSCPICAPSRAALLTGRYQQRFGFDHNPGPEAVASENFGLPVTEKTLAERLKTLGYATGMVGKWHLGFKPALTPTKRGFDEFYGFLGGAHNYLPRERELRGSIMRGDQPVEEEDYLTEAFGREAADFVQKHRKEPFFLYMPFNAVHAPMDAMPKYLKRFDRIENGKRRTFAAMLCAMDDAVGRVLEKVRKHGLEENTLIFFISDNGGPTQQTSSRNDPLRGVKGQVYEGGIRVPFAAQWKGTLPAGRVVNDPVMNIDILPTAIAAASGAPGADDKIEGVNLLPFLKGTTHAAPHDRLFWRMGKKLAVRSGNWKLVGERNRAPELYDLSKDIAEEDNLASTQAEKLKELQAGYDEWNAKNIPPQWTRQDGHKADDADD